MNKMKTDKLLKFLQDSLQDRLTKNGPHSFFSLGKLKHAQKALKVCRKVLLTSKRWQRLKGGALCYNGETSLPFCAMLGPIFAVEFNGKSMRLQTVLIQREKKGPVYGYAFDASRDTERLSKELHLSKEEGAALTSMLQVGKDLLMGAEHLLWIESREFLPTAQAAASYHAFVEAQPECEEPTLSAVWEKLGETGREIALAGILSQLAAKAEPEERPALVVNFVKCGQNFHALRTILGAVNFSAWPGANGTAPSICTVAVKDPLPFSHGEMELYDAGRRGDVFLAELERCQNIQAHCGSVYSPFQTVPLLLTSNISMNGGVWNVELEDSLVELSSDEQDCLRAAASVVLQNPAEKFVGLYWEVFMRGQNPYAYRTTLAERWRTAMASCPLRWWFSNPNEQEHAGRLLTADEVIRKERAQQRAQQMGRALEVLFDPATYKNGGVQLKPNEWEKAQKILEKSFALYYAPSPDRTKNVGPFLCFTEASIQRLLAVNQIAVSLTDEVIRRVTRSDDTEDRRAKEGKNKTGQRGKTDTVSFKEGGSKRLIKVDVGNYPALLTSLQCLQKNSKE